MSLKSSCNCLQLLEMIPSQDLGIFNQIFESFKKKIYKKLYGGTSVYKVCQICGQRLRYFVLRNTLFSCIRILRDLRKGERPQTKLSIKIPFLLRVCKGQV